MSCREYGHLLGEDIVHVFKQPTRWSSKQWKQVGSRHRVTKGCQAHRVASGTQARAEVFEESVRELGGGLAGVNITKWSCSDNLGVRFTG